MCYTVPLAGAVVTSIAWNRTKSIKVWWLSLMFYGGALFGAIDHLWNKELLLISEHIISDLLLGALITAIILVSWIAIVIYSRRNPTISPYISVK